MPDSDLSKSIIANASKGAPEMTGKALRWLIDLAIFGAKGMPSAQASAGRQLRARKGEVEKAIDSLIFQHVALAGTQGFLTNLGGILVSVATMPANLSAVAVLQSRMVAGIAHLRGYDITDSRVHQAVLLTLLGEKIVNNLVADGKLPGSPLVVATAPVTDENLEQLIAEHVMAALFSQSGGKQVASLLGKRVPVIGGGVGLAADSYNTFAVGRYARAQFVSRRPAIRDRAEAPEN